MNRLITYFKPTVEKGKLLNPNYFKYIGWSFVTNVLISTENALATSEMLDRISSFDSITRFYTYVGKDIIGQIGGLIYIAKMGNIADNKSKKFLLYSNIAQQSAYFMILSSPYICIGNNSNNMFLLVSILSSTLFNISFASQGAINAKCIQKLSDNTNIAEIYGKLTLINTLGSTIGMCLGMTILLSKPSIEIKLVIIPILGVARVYTYNKAVQNLL